MPCRTVVSKNCTGEDSQVYCSRFAAVIAYCGCLLGGDLEGGNFMPPTGHSVPWCCDPRHWGEFALVFLGLMIGALFRNKHVKHSLIATENVLDALLKLLFKTF